MRDLDAELGAIMAALPANAVTDEQTRQEYETLFAYCALSMHGGLDWPYRELLHDMAALSNGYGCWLDAARDAITAAPITDESAELWHVALNGARALLQFAHIENSAV